MAVRVTRGVGCRALSGAGDASPGANATGPQQRLDVVPTSPQPHGAFSDGIGTTEQSLLYHWAQR